MKKARILLADDHPLFAHGSRVNLGEHYEIVDVVSDGQTLVEAALRLKPDLIVLDISMPLLSGIEAARRVKKRLPQVKLLFFTMHSETTYLQAAFDSGASGYLLKTAASEELLKAVQVVLRSQVYISSDLSEHLGHLPDQSQMTKAVTLSPREREVLQLISEGRSGKEIAAVLGISVRTASFHRENIKRKLGVRTVAGLTRDAIASGLM